MCWLCATSLRCTLFHSRVSHLVINYGFESLVVNASYFWLLVLDKRKQHVTILIVIRVVAITMWQTWGSYIWNYLCLLLWLCEINYVLVSASAARSLSIFSFAKFSSAA